MPTYVYKFVKTGETIEVQQTFDEDTLTKYKHPETGRVMAVKKVFQPVGVTFKGSGFFKTDNRASANGSTNGTPGSSEAGGGDSTGTTSSDSKAATTSDSTSTKTPTSTSKTDTPAKQPAKATTAAAGSD